jgi:uncharacterized membrane protein/Mg-chelatase subunit ChlD
MTVMALALPFDLPQPAWLWLCLVVPVLIAVSLRSLAGLDPARRMLAVITRSLLVILIALCLAGIRSVQRSDDLTVIFLMDRSDSVEQLEPYQESFIRRAADGIPSDDRLGMIEFARDAFVQQLPMRGGYFLPPGRLPAMPGADRTNIAAALRLAMAMFPEDAAKRIVILSDGNDNYGDVLAEARRAGADGIPVDVVPMWYQHRNEVYFDRLIAPAYAEEGEQIALRMILHTNAPVSGTISVYQNNQLVPLTPEQNRVQLLPGNNTFFMKLGVPSTGTQTFDAVFQPDDETMDAVAQNNTASAFTFVSTSARVLLISNQPAYDEPLAGALRSENVAVEIKTPEELGTFGLLQMMDYATIMLANVPAASFTEQQQRELAIYVRDLGSGLVMLGGDESFGAGGWIGSPVEEVMPVTFEIKHKRVIPKGALVVIMHSCEIARGNYWGREMAKKSVDTVSSQDLVGVLAYSYSPPGENWEVPLAPATNKAAIKARLDRMQIGDMPDFSRCMEMAYNELTRGTGRDAAQRHVIVLSDGDPSPPSQALLTKYADAKITVSTIALGWGMHVMEAPMRRIAEQTGGRYYAARNPRQLPQIFSKESQVVRRPLIVDEPFPPRIVYGDSDLLLGSLTTRDALPPLGGMVLTSAKPHPNVLMPIIRATDDGDDPVLAHWQYGLGKAIAFTSGYWPVWGRDWMPWEKFAKFWAQTVRWSMRQDAPANFDVATHIEAGRGRIAIDALDLSAGYLNNLQLRAKLIDPSSEAVDIPFHQKGPGSYEAEFPAERYGQYLASVQVFDNGRYLGTVRTGLSVPFSPEYRDLATNEALLRQLADTTGGRWLDSEAQAANVFSHDLPPAIARKPIWDWVLAWLVLPLFLLDVAVRRLASWLAFSVAVELVVLAFLWFGMGYWHVGIGGILGSLIVAEIVGWIIRYRYIGPLFEFVTHTVTVLAQAGDRSAASLERLKGKRESIRRELKKGPARTPEREEPEQKPVPSRRARQRFDVGDAQARKAAGDLHEALGGAGAEMSRDDQLPADSKARPIESEDESVTSHLLRHKRKRRRKDDE